MTKHSVSLDDDLRTALSGSISLAMNQLGRQLAGGDIEPLIWTPYPADDRYDYDGGLLRGFAAYPPAEVPDVLRRWARVLGLETAPAQDPDELRYIGFVGLWNIDVTGPTTGASPTSSGDGANSTHRC